MFGLTDCMGNNDQHDGSGYYIPISMPYPVRQKDCWWEGVIETPNAVFAYFGTPACSDWLRIKIDNPISYRVTKELPAVELCFPEPHSCGMSPDGLAYEVIGGSFPKEISGDGLVEALYPLAKHYLIVTGDSELEAISTLPPQFEMVPEGQRPDLP